MDIGPWSIALGALASFAIGLLSPTIKSYVDQTLGARVQRRENRLLTADQRSDASAEAFLEGLEDLEARLTDYLKLMASRDRSIAQAESSGDQLRAIWKSASQLEYTTFGLNEQPRKAISQVLPILRYAYDLGQHVDFGVEVVGYHPESAIEIFNQTGRYCRSVLEAARRRESVPATSDAVQEYLLALDDRTADRSQEYAMEQAEYEEPIKIFRTQHGLPPSREAE